MPGPRPNKLDDELDALLDGRPVELTDQLAPLAEAAEAIRVELATYQLDPEVADRHLERVLEGSATVVRMPTRPQPDGWDLRRRVVAVALAAALVLAPATMASAAALPGQAMYPFKLAIEELRIAAVQWSPSREAGERTRVADVRVGEVDSLVSLKMFNQLPNALTALGRAVDAARAAVAEAAAEGEPVPEVAAELGEVTASGAAVVMRAVQVARGSVALSPRTKQAIQDAAQDSQVVLVPPTDDRTPSGATPTPTNPGTRPGSGSGPGSTIDPPPTRPTPPPTTNPPTTNPPTTNPPTTNPPTTNPPTTNPPTTNPPTTEDTATPGSVGGGGELGVGERLELEDVPTTTTIG